MFFIRRCKICAWLFFRRCCLVTGRGENVTGKTPSALLTNLSKVHSWGGKSDWPNVVKEPVLDNIHPILQSSM